MSNVRQSGFCLAMTAILACCVMVAILPPASVGADLPPPWKVHNKLLGKPKDAAGLESKKSEDVSGIACATSGFPRLCLIVDDESQGAQIVIVNDGDLIAGDFIRLITDVHEGKPLELDAEGAAYDDVDKSFYVIGSHGRARHEDDSNKEAKNKAKAEASRHVFRIRLKADAVDVKTGKLAATPDIKPSSLSGLIQAQAELAPWFDKPLDANGLTIEGVAVFDRRLYAGMRGPVLDDGSAVMLSAPLTAIFDGQVGESKLHRVNLGKDTAGKPRGIRDIVVYRGAFLLIAGPVSDPPSGDIKPADYAIFRYDGAVASKLLDLDPYGNAVKPEALLPLEEKDGKLRALLFFDGPEEGEPRPVEFKLQ